MAQAMTETERRLNRHAEAISTLAAWLRDTQPNFKEEDFEEIKAILNGTHSPTERNQ